MLNILSPFPANPATHHPAGTRVTVRTSNGGEGTGWLIRPLSLSAVHHGLGAESADMAIEGSAGFIPASIPCNRITSVTVHYRTQGAAA